MNAVEPSSLGATNIPRQETTRRRRVLVALTLWALSTCLQAQAEPFLETSLLGGPATWARLVGDVESSPEHALVAVNQTLLDTIEPDHDWKRVPARAEADRYLRLLTRLAKDFGTTVNLSATKQGRSRFADVARTLGYKAKYRKNDLELIPQEGPEAAAARRLARALGWDLDQIGSNLSSSAQSLEIPRSTATVPLTASEWRALSGKPAPDDVMGEIIRDQRLSLVMEGARHLSAESRAAMAGVGWDRVYRKAIQFHRYAPALQFRGGDLVFPGGGEARTAWAGVLRSNIGDTEQFVRDLLDNRKARGANLLHSLSYLEPAVADFYIGAGDSATASKSGFARDVFLRLDDSAAIDFDSARGGDLGFGTFVRSLPLADNSTSIQLPGGPGLWYAAVRWADAPTDLQGLSRAVRRADKESMTQADFILRLLTEENDVLGVKRSALPRLLRTVNLFGTDTELLTSGNVILLARASDTMPAALDILDVIELQDPETLRDYLLAVAHLNSTSHSRDKELLLANFQGGVEWLRAMSLAQRVAPEVLEARLAAWSKLHLGVRAPRPAASSQLRWIRETLEALPEPTFTIEARDPFEARLIFALIPFAEDTSFSYQGLGYVSARPQQFAAAAAKVLTGQGVAAADTLVKLDQAFAEATSAARSGALEATRAGLGAVRRAVAALPEPRVDLPERDPERFWERVLPTDRAGLDSRLNKLSKIDRVKRLSGVDAQLQEAKQLLAQELRPFLLAPAYLRAIGDDPNVLAGDPNFLRKHLLFNRPDQEIGSDNGWNNAQVDREDAAESGVLVRGALPRVATALAQFRLSLGSDKLIHFRAFFQDTSTTRWHAIAPERSAAVHELMKLGDVITQAAFDEGPGGPVRLFVSHRLPLARLERAAAERPYLISPSERFSLALALVLGDGRPELGNSDFDAQAARNAIDRLGEDASEQLATLSASTPRLNGRSRRWVGTWPPYELLDQHQLPNALSERMLLDLKFAILDYLGRRGLPGDVGGDLSLRLIEDSSNITFSSMRDWESFLKWIATWTDTEFDALLRDFFTRGMYRVEGI